MSMKKTAHSIRSPEENGIRFPVNLIHWHLSIKVKECQNNKYGPQNYLFRSRVKLTGSNQYFTTEKQTL